MKPNLWEFACFEEKVNELYLNEDHQIVPEVIKLENQKDFLGLSQTRMKGWDGAAGDPKPWRSPSPRLL